MTYEIDIAGMKRQLPLCPVTDDLYIGAFVMFGDVELTVHAAAELLKRVPEFDYIVAPEAKSIPLAYEVRVQSITTAGEQTLIIDTADAEKIRGKRVLILDDVISTGESLRATEELVNRAGGIIVAKAAVLAEGDAASRPDLTVLAPLPLFNPDGSVKG